jgi:hypothetical protein|tara:strand:+ start:501 stop:1067 length:567 start_codon:yes stop_codon:yes gene_type:complete
MAITTSLTEINAIDATYPVAGQDNDSQGFRDNFNNIKTSLTKARADLSSLDTNTAKLNTTNDFNGETIQEANFLATTDVAYGIGNVSAPQNVNWSNGSYQTIQVGADLTLTLAQWPASGKLGKLRMVVTSDGPSRVVTWATSGGTLRKDSAFPGSFAIASSTQPKIVDFWTSDGGTIVYAQFVGTFGT